MSRFENEKAAYLLCAKLKAHQKRVSAAISTVEEALSQSKNPALSFSSGKDSVVLLDIAAKSGFRGDLIFFKYGVCADIETPRENIDLLKRSAEKYGLKYHILDCLGEVDCWEECGRFTLFPETQRERKIFHRTNYDFAKKSEEFCRDRGIDLQIIGMRKDESKRRKAVLNKRGQIYATKARESMTCCPLANMTDDDIWAYIFSNRLEYLPVYDYPYLDRRKNRNEITMLYNNAILENGMLYHYQRMYPEFFVWLKERWGEGAGL